MRIYFKYLFFLFLVSFSFSHYGGSIGLIGQFAKNEFKDAGVNSAIGIDFNILYYPVTELGLGINLGGSEYGKYRRQIPFSYYSDLITITEETTNNIFHGHLFFKIIPFNWKVQPYFEGLIGFKNLNTSTSLYNQSSTCDDPGTDYNECEIASSTNANDFAISYGWGLGLDIFLLNFNKEEEEGNGQLYFFVNGRYLWGGEAEYLKEGDIEFSDPDLGPVTTTYNWNTTKTDLLQFSIGVSFNGVLF